jgi:hypothetical protein
LQRAPSFTDLVEEELRKRRLESEYADGGGGRL